MSIKATKIDLADLVEINPMIQTDGSLYPVSDVLEVAALILDRVADGSIEISQTGNHGISVILETCAAALRKMQEERES